MKNILVSHVGGILMAILGTVIVGNMCSAVPNGSPIGVKDVMTSASTKVGDTLERLINGKKNFQVVKTMVTSYYTHIAFLKHTNGKKYILKQETRGAMSRHMTVIRDALGSLIAREAGILANLVVIIPPEYSFPGKYSTLFPASLHEVVPGVRVDQLPKQQQSFKLPIKQCLNEVRCQIRGLTREIITNMAFHPDLCRIVALDTFIANGDRHRGNFFYDAASDHYYAIDLESSFKRDSARYACVLIRSMLRDKTSLLSTEELKGLSIYRDTLKTLVRRFSLNDIYEYLIDFAVQGGFISRSGVRRYLELYKTMIKQNYESCKKLIVLLDMLIRKQKMHVPHSVSHNASHDASPHGGRVMAGQNKIKSDMPSTGKK